RGGWTWYTGSAGWLYRLIIETLLGLEVRGEKLRLTPRLPPGWPGCEITYRHRETIYRIKVVAAAKPATSTMTLTLDGNVISGSEIPLRDDRKEHRVLCQLT
ncbi:MAG: cyclic beta,2-glucan synthetase, partial [Verrucomicrobiota bacterium]